ncbi:fungal-specific transcription factor domain-containing protein [Penicillium herquei]|nr:fungal-specific transcription factor domain-containing protein [Penicillium herquei]
MAIPQEPKARTEEESSHSASGTYLDDFEVNGTSIERSPLPESPDAITDQEGRYVGPASGLSFLARVQKRLHNSHPTSSTFTFGDAPMAEYDPVPSIMISPEESSRLVKTFFEFTIPIDRIIHRQTIEEWLEHFQQTLGAMRDVENAPAQRAILWMIFAMAQEHKTEAEAETTEDRSRRTFWSAYCLDTHLSLTLGRPKIFHDDDIDQELPSGIDDLSVHRDILAPAKSLEYSTMIAPVAYYRVIVNDGVKECLGAAMNVVNRVCQMFQDGMMFRSFWGACYYGFSAAAVLFVYTIQQASLPADVYQQYLNSATRFENHLATFATDNALVARYALVLQELQLEALNQIQCHSSPSGCSMTASQMDAMALQYADILGVRMPLSTTVDEGLVHAPADIATWLELESLHAF